MEVVVLPDNGFCGPPAGINYWQILNATEGSMAETEREKGKEGEREGGNRERNMEMEREYTRIKTAKSCGIS